MCPLCELIEACEKGTHPRLVHEFRTSYLVVGEHQLHKGYCVLVLKEHETEMTGLEAGTQASFLKELMIAAQAIEQAYAPSRMNFACYGNSVPHLHWHLFPRYANDPDKGLHPWIHMDEFPKHATTDEMAAEVAASVRRHLL